MQQTKLDLWLRRKFVYINRVYCNTLPDLLPLGLQVEEAPEESGGRYLYKLTTRSERILKDLVQALELQNITYTSRVDDIHAWYTRFLNNPHKSFTFTMVWAMIGFTGFVFAISGAPQKIWAALMDEEEEVAEEAKPEQDAKIYHKADIMREIDRVR